MYIIYIECMCIFFNGNTCSMLFCRLFSPFQLGLQVVEFPIPGGLPVKGVANRDMGEESD